MYMYISLRASTIIILCICSTKFLWLSCWLMQLDGQFFSLALVYWHHGKYCNSYSLYTISCDHNAIQTLFCYFYKHVEVY